MKVETLIKQKCSKEMRAKIFPHPTYKAIKNNKVYGYALQDYKYLTDLRIAIKNEEFKYTVFWFTSYFIMSIITICTFENFYKYYINSKDKWADDELKKIMVVKRLEK